MCKVDVAADRFDLNAPTARYDSLDAYLLARWTGADGAESEGYKSLTDWFNRRLLKRVYELEGRDATSVRAESEYEALTGEDDVRRDEVAADLRADGIDAEELRRAMVSWSTMRRHLNGCLDGEKPERTATTDWERESVRVAADRVREKVRSALTSLVGKGRLADGEGVGVDVQVKLSCPECPARVPLEDALDRGYVCREHAAGVDDAVADVEVPAGGNSESSRGLVPFGAASFLGASLAEEAAVALQALLALAAV
ncbi:rod-determining factor RdfA [Halogeometricum luteum]|uniref:Uncharacterized protein n=1 Tax=Halogeometricum luteum TaxID=2950537 RepID=A0ABU2G0K0_9EURY|nr:rod-determining factor RdfA [Halogeometricum sp. S3BR5-2]MDS0293824.1 hypothetical protein [Halogeometricum sp. S3BR5-2]